MKRKQFVYDRLAAHYDGAMRPLERIGLAVTRVENHLLGGVQLIVCRVV